MQPHTLKKIRNALLSAVFTSVVLHQGAFATFEKAEEEEQTNQLTSSNLAEEGDLVDNLHTLPLEMILPITNFLSTKEAVRLSEVCKDLIDAREVFIYTKSESVKYLDITSLYPFPLKYYINLTSLDLDYNDTITDDAVRLLTNLISLNLSWNNTITDEAVKLLTKLTSLNLEGNHKITDEAVKVLPNLTILNLAWNNRITDKAVKALTNLTSLNLFNNRRITDACIQALRERGVKIIGK
ncbi:MAG: leucine-rich repeat domain-containing protein [Microcystis sp. M169S2]|nr:leucine-rich repeat domain-containing protein [Microcystis sp. M169S2]